MRHQVRKLERQAEYSHRLEREVAARTEEWASQNRELAELNTKLQEVSVTDSLTGLWNRRYLANEIPKDIAMIGRARVDDREVTAGSPRQVEPSLLFLMLDLDGLKGVNDTYGHQAGDRVIVQTKELLARVCRDSDTLTRWGGDEFLLVGRQTDREAAATLSDRLRHAIASHRFELGNGDTVRLSCSVGFSFYPFSRSSPSMFTWEQVLGLADRALYRAKQGGRNQWVGVLGAADADPAVAFRRKDEDLETLAEDGIVELHAGCPDSTSNHANRETPTRSSTPLVQRPS
ncbi:MAG: GGDEF domain-containing protein [Acidobacteria bacterium]|nr:GGDEF domain-containing protein [Acidobacteriota bacterium]